MHEAGHGASLPSVHRTMRAETILAGGCSKMFFLQVVKVLTGLLLSETRWLPGRKLPAATFIIHMLAGGHRKFGLAEDPQG